LNYHNDSVKVQQFLSWVSWRVRLDKVNKQNTLFIHFKHSEATVMNPNTQTDQIYPLKSPKVGETEAKQSL